MAKKSAIQKNMNRKNLIERLHKKRLSIKKLLKNKEMSFEERIKTQIKIDSMPRNSSKIRFRNRCFLSGRPRGIYSKFNLSRIAIRDLAGKGQIPGLTKASW
ncbi:MAG: 30S ribosomal protein S14 [Pelagibacteraceae bacterium]|nr:30S ribosomal protein S14 [Pelagibacteraceae bacterium]|tara:strand:- start:386 stop:691 length:306 start_codon:yes stop_codon:yes gene_type:complete